ncbi:TFIIE alpha subunit-domain-containing protein [Tuber indicum]|nr:TFIIE alpha subunit-domain-containing protein [Tuber indicum]
MEIAKSLVKCVARAFYDTKHILVIDALMIHNAVRDDELGKLLGFQSKDLQKLCGRLKEDRMLAVHNRPEQKEGQQRPTNRTYYYVEFRSTIDAVKYRMHGVVKDVEKKMNKDADTKGYVCPYCQKRFSILDAMSVARDEMGLFVCDRCNTTLVDDDDSAEVKTSQERLGRLMEQMKKIIDMLKMIDEIVVPVNDFEAAIANSVPVPRDKNHLYSVPVAGKGATSTRSSGAPASIEVSFTSTSEKTAAELASEQAMKQAQAEKNALPVWHTKSTVDPGATTTAGAKEAAEREARALDGIGIAQKSKEEEGKKAAASDGANGIQADAIAEYYAALAAQKAKEAQEEQEDDDDDEEEEDGEEGARGIEGERHEEEEDEGEDDDEDDDDEGNFEDVVNSNAFTPPTATNSIKAKDDDSDDDSTAPAAKKPRLTETEEKEEGGEEDSDEEADFEDLKL